MDIRPILSTLRRHKTAAGLIVLEIALTSAIICNALHLVSTRFDRMHHDTGLPEAELVTLTLRGVDAGTPAQADEQTARDLQALRALPGVKSAAVINQIVYGTSSNNSGVRLTPSNQGDATLVAQYDGGEQTLATLGLALQEGRDFKAEEYIAGSFFNQQEKPNVGQVIINRHLADQLFPGRSAVGQVIYLFGVIPSTVIGVVRQLPHPYPGTRMGSALNAMLLPLRPSYRGGSYVLTTICFASRVPSSAASWIVYSPPSISGGSAKSLRATPSCTSTRFCATIAPRGDRSCIVSPAGGPPISVRVARRSARNQIVSPGWYSGLSVIT